MTADSTKVFLVQHVRSEDEDDEDVKLIGVFSSRETAEEAVNRLRQTSGFSEFPDGFYTDEYTLDRIHWEEGFIV